MEDFRHERHSVSKLVVHLVCVTKYRRKVLAAAALDWLDRHARQVFAKMDCKLLASDGEADHLHILVEYPPKLSVSVLVNAFKGTSSRVLRRLRPELAVRRWQSSSSMLRLRGGTLPPRPEGRGFRVKHW